MVGPMETGALVLPRFCGGSGPVSVKHSTARGISFGQTERLLTIHFVLVIVSVCVESGEPPVSHKP
jgi:hypothetical protein